MLEWTLCYIQHRGHGWTAERGAYQDGVEAGILQLGDVGLIDT